MKNVINQINQAIYLLNSGEIIAFPTEGVFGFGSNLFSPIGCSKLFEAKGRSYDKPLSLLCQNLSQGLNFAYFSDTALKLANTFWPGPLTLVLPIMSSENHLYLSNIFAKKHSIAIRVPDHWLTLLLINQLGYPLASSSANLASKLSATSSKDINADFTNQVFTLEGKVNIGIESTILDLTDENKIKILRSGPITAEDIFNKTKIIVSECFVNFAPITEITLKKGHRKFYICLNFGASNLKGDYTLNFSTEGDFQEAALNFYNYLRIINNCIEKLGSKTIIIRIAKVPYKGIGIALNHRLEEFKKILETQYNLR